MRFLAVLGALASAALVSAAVVLATGVYDVAADEPHWQATERVIEWARLRSVDHALGEVGSAPNLDDAAVLRKGAADYSEMCTVCHSAPGMDPSPMRQGLYPKPPDFTRVTVPRDRAFWTIKHGLKMTGMPAWGATHDDATIWSMVALIERLPTMSRQEYDQLVSSAPREGAMPGGHSHGGGHSDVHPGGMEHMRQ